VRRRRLVFHLSVALTSAAFLMSASACSSTNGSEVRRPTTTAGTSQLTTAEGIKQAFALIGNKTGGPVLVRSATIFPNYMVAEVQDPKNPENLYEYLVRGGKIEQTKPVQLTGPDKNLSNLYPVEAVNWAKLSELFRAGGTVIGIDAPPGYLIVEGDNDGTIRVLGYLNGPRRSGRWEATGDGEIIDRTIN